MTGSTLVGADLDGANLQNANLTSADPSGTDLRGADLRGVLYVPVNLGFPVAGTYDFLVMTRLNDACWDSTTRWPSRSRIAQGVPKGPSGADLYTC